MPTLLITTVRCLTFKGEKNRVSEAICLWPNISGPSQAAITQFGFFIVIVFVFFLIIHIFLYNILNYEQLML